MNDRSTEEIERPAEWLLRFEEDDRRYRALLDDSGSLAVAAFRLARARCRVQPISSAVPTSLELWAAARRIMAHTDKFEMPLSRLCLASECESHGLL